MTCWRRLCRLLRTRDPVKQTGNEPIEDGELLLRRLPAVHYPGKKLSPAAFRPTDADITGLSVSRAKYNSAARLGASGRPGSEYYVAELNAGDLRRYGVRVEPRPTSEDPGHAELPDLTRAVREEKSPRYKETTEALARKLTRRVLGPYRS